MHIIGTILGLVAAWWVYTDAQKFGHSKTTAVAWAIGVFCALIIALPLYLLFGRKPAMRSSRKQDDVIDIEGEVIKNMIPCPMCGKKVEDTKNICPYCGFSIKRTCPNCGAEVSRAYHVCPSCSTTLDGK